MKCTISESRTKQLLAGINEGTLDYDKISMAEYLQLSFLMAFHGSNGVEVSQRIMYGGNMYVLHACVDQVVTNEKPTALRTKQ